MGVGGEDACQGHHSKRRFLVPVSPEQLLPRREGRALHLPAWLPAERPEGELKWQGMGTRAWPGGRTQQGGPNQSTDTASANHTCRRYILSLKIALLAHCRCSFAQGMLRVIAGKAAMLPAAPAELCWVQRSAQCPTVHLGHAVLHSPSSCNTCSPSGCFISLDQK